MLKIDGLNKKMEKKIHDIVLICLDDDDNDITVSDIYQVIGEEATLKLIKYLGGNKINLPKADDFEVKYKTIIAMLDYKLLEKDYYEVAEKLYGKNNTVAQRRRLRDNLRDLKKYLMNNDIDIDLIKDYIR